MVTLLIMWGHSVSKSITASLSYRKVMLEIIKIPERCICLALTLHSCQKGEKVGKVDGSNQWFGNAHSVEAIKCCKSIFVDQDRGWWVFQRIPHMNSRLCLIMFVTSLIFYSTLGTKIYHVVVSIILFPLHKHLLEMAILLLILNILLLVWSSLLYLCCAWSLQYLLWKTNS